MRNLLALAAFLALTFTVLGWWLGWYRLNTNPAPDGHRSVTIDVNSKKIGSDLEKGREKLRDLLDKKDGTPSTTTVPNPVPSGGTQNTTRSGITPPSVQFPVDFETSDDGSFILRGNVRPAQPK